MLDGGVLQLNIANSVAQSPLDFVLPALLELQVINCISTLEVVTEDPATEIGIIKKVNPVFVVLVAETGLPEFIQSCEPNRRKLQYAGFVLLC
jgi:hypothetical protein